MVEFDKYGNKTSDESFKRDIDKQDVAYRKKVKLTFEKRLKDILPQNYNLCFHGTPIWNCKQILKSGNISSLADRVGERENILPIHNKIYVSTINNLWFTIRYHADLSNYNYPAGCIFVIEPKDDEIKSSKHQNIINNIYFDKEPKRLKNIITTPENIDLVKSWVMESGLKINDSIVVNYEQFLTLCQGYDNNQQFNL
ncbi:MAG: hypothetical protein ACLRFE_03920 [Clostridia bacterium]